MTTITVRATSLLRRALLLDGVASGGLGVLLTVAAGPSPACSVARTRSIALWGSS